MTHVFISYVRENRDVVDRLARDLSDRGATVWLDRKDIGAGSRWRDEIKRAIRNGDFFLACFSKESEHRQRSYMNEELTLAIDLLREMPADRTWFIPVIIDNGHIPQRRISSVEDLSDLHAVDLSGDWASGIELILKAIGINDAALSIALPLTAVARSFDFVDESVRAIERLGGLQLADRRILRVLIDATTSATQHRIKVAAVEALVRIGRDAVPALAAALPTAEEVSRKCILHALEEIGPPAAAALPEIIAVLQETRGTVPEHLATVQERAIRALMAVGPAAASAVSHLAVLLEDSYRVIRTLAVVALIAIEPAKAASLLVEACKEPEVQKDVIAGVVWARLAGHQQQAWRILERIGLPAAVPSLIAILEGDHEAGPRVRLTEEAVNVLKWIGPDAAAAVPALSALRQSQPEIEGLESALQNIQALRHDHPHSRRRRSRAQG